MMRCELGDKVKVRKIIESRKLRNFETGNFEKKWISRECELEGIVIGRRCVREGSIYYGADYIAFTPQKYIKCYLVAYDLHRNPVYVLPEDLEVLEDEQA
jgi:hypothetical protein